MRLDSPLALSLAGTIAIHTILIVLGDAVAVYNPPRPPPPAPRIEMIEIEVPPVIEEPPPPLPVPEPEPEPESEPEPIEPPERAPEVARTQVKAAATTEQPAVEQPSVDPAPGGGHVVTLDHAPPSATGVPVGVGKRPRGRIGRGGTGGGTGAGTGSGAGPVVATPVSVATIKKRAMPKGDYGYFDLGKDYPLEARQLEIEGPIRVKLVVNERGEVTSAVLINKLGHGLDELALRRARELAFEPALDTDDRPVASVVVWTFHMTLPK